MKKLISLLILGCFSLYGFSINPIDPPAKKGEPVKTITLPSPAATEECSDSRSLVDVTVYVTFTDCPDYDCDYPAYCTFDICIYDQNGTTLIGCTEFDLKTCQYEIGGLRAEEDHYLKARLVLTSSPPCNSSYNTSDATSINKVPFGGGTVYINTTYCP
ncbi:MAG: hypothetical protein ISS19_15825 [Bacteroidales bacterium]|nr:hypothetical protein [Bacteroidales bacterium]